jgi:tellurite resistance protein
VTDELFGDRRRALEDQYFRKREQEIREKLQRRHAQEATRQRMAERTGVADEEILRDLETLGYAPETVMLLHLVPLVQLAWAEGIVDDRERALIIEAARSRGIDEGSAADRQLTDWLKTRPSDDFFEGTLRAIGTILHLRPADERDAAERDLLSYSTAIASASGGILGFGKISPQERAVLARISNELERAHGPVAPKTPPGD